MTDLELLLIQLRQAFPNQIIRGPLRLLGEGFYSTAVQSADGMVFRVGRTPRAAAGYAREASVLPALQGLLPAAVPRPELYIAGGGEVFPHGMIAYPGLPGSELDPGALNSGELAAAAGQIASIILTLQRIPPGRFGLVDDVSARRERWARQRARVLPALREGFGPGEYDALCQWWEALLADDTMHDYAPVFHHGDLWYGNLLADGPRITAVLDWSDLGAGDPVLDFVPQKYPGEEFFNHVLAAFERAGGALPAGFHYRLARLRVLRELDGLEYAVLQNDAAEFDDSIIKLRREMGFS